MSNRVPLCQAERRQVVYSCDPKVNIIFPKFPSKQLGQFDILKEMI